MRLTLERLESRDAPSALALTALGPLLMLPPQGVVATVILAPWPLTGIIDPTLDPAKPS